MSNHEFEDPPIKRSEMNPKESFVSLTFFFAGFFFWSSKTGYLDSKGFFNTWNPDPKLKKRLDMKSVFFEGLIDFWEASHCVFFDCSRLLLDLQTTEIPADLGR